jgi:hypothetical protein
MRKASLNNDDICERFEEQMICDIRNYIRSGRGYQTLPQHDLATIFMEVIQASSCNYFNPTLERARADLLTEYALRETELPKEVALAFDALLQNIFDQLSEASRTNLTDQELRFIQFIFSNNAQRN